MAKWFINMKKADFNGIARKYGVSTVIARIMRNREVRTDEEINLYLNGTPEDLYDGRLMKDMECAVSILKEKIAEEKKIRIIGDYDIDGVNSTYILQKGLELAGADVDTDIPHRIKDGYGLNRALVDRAYQDGVDTILTCDNGIAAIEEIAYGKEKGMTVIVTDHHEVKFKEENGVRIYQIPAADAVIDPHQKDCNYPYKELCGAGVAYKLVRVLLEELEMDPAKAEYLIENVAIATIGDVVNLTGENRIFVRTGLEMLKKTKNEGLKALFECTGIDVENLNTYHIGFVIGPCINACGRLDTAKRALELLNAPGRREAVMMAEDLKALNESRKEMTEKGVERAVEMIETSALKEDCVLVVYLPDVHESLAGIIAGRIREACYKPTFVLTKSEDGVKGSGRSIEAYSMYEELCKCQELFTKFGGHPMAAGLSLPEANVEIFREKINACCGLTEEDFIPKIKIDIPMPVDYPDIPLVNELLLLEPFGKANVKPQFADKNLGIDRAVVVGKNQNVLKLTLKTERGKSISAVYFGDVEKFREYYGRKYGENEVQQAFLGRTNGIRMSVVYYPEINRYQGNESIQIVIKNYQ